MLSWVWQIFTLIYTLRGCEVKPKCQKVPETTTSSTLASRLCSIGLPGNWWRQGCWDTTELHNTMALQKRVGDITETVPMFYTVYDSGYFFCFQRISRYDRGYIYFIDLSVWGLKTMDTLLSPSFLQQHYACICVYIFSVQLWRIAVRVNHPGK